MVNSSRTGELVPVGVLEPSGPALPTALPRGSGETKTVRPLAAKGLPRRPTVENRFVQTLASSANAPLPLLTVSAEALESAQQISASAL